MFWVWSGFMKLPSSGSRPGAEEPLGKVTPRVYDTMAYVTNRPLSITLLLGLLRLNNCKSLHAFSKQECLQMHVSFDTDETASPHDPDSLDAVLRLRLWTDSKRVYRREGPGDGTLAVSRGEA